MKIRYFSNLPSQPRSSPADGLPAVGVVADPTVPKSVIGIAYPYTHIGGSRPGDLLQSPAVPPEVVWRIVLDRVWRDGRVVSLATRETLDPRYVLRDGEFVELAEEAI